MYCRWCREVYKTKKSIALLPNIAYSSKSWHRDDSTHLVTDKYTNLRVSTFIDSSHSLLMGCQGNRGELEWSFDSLREMAIFSGRLKQVWVCTWNLLNVGKIYIQLKKLISYSTAVIFDFSSALPPNVAKAFVQEIYANTF